MTHLERVEKAKEALRAALDDTDDTDYAVTVILASSDGGFSIVANVHVDCRIRMMKDAIHM